MWCLSKGSQSTKLRQSTRNQGSSTTRLQSCQNRQQKPKNHSNNLRLSHRNTQIQIQIRKNQKRSTLKSYCKNPQRRSQRLAVRQADQHKGHRQGRTRG